MKSKPRLFKTKKGARYIKYNGRKYRINSTVSDRYIIKNFFDIIKQLIKHRKRRASRKTTTNSKQEHKQPTISGSVDVGNIIKFTTQQINDQMKLLKDKSDNSNNNTNNNQTNNNTDLDADISNKQKINNLLVQRNKTMEEQYTRKEGELRNLQSKKEKELIDLQKKIDNLNKKYTKLQADLELTKKQVEENKEELEQKDLEILRKTELIDLNNQKIQKIEDELELRKKNLDVFVENYNKIVDEFDNLAEEKKQAEELSNQLEEDIANAKNEKEDLLQANRVLIQENKNNLETKEKLENQIKLLQKKFEKIQEENNIVVEENKQIQEEKNIIQEQNEQQKIEFFNNKLLKDGDMIKNIDQKLNLGLLHKQGIYNAAKINKINENPKGSTFIKIAPYFYDINDNNSLDNLLDKFKEFVSKIKFDKLTTLSNIKKVNLKGMKPINDVLRGKYILLSKFLDTDNVKYIIINAFKNNLSLNNVIDNLELEEEINDVDNELEKLKPLEAELENENKGSGLANNHSGLWNYDIEKLMQQYGKKGFVGVYSVDKLNKVPVDASKNSISFIMNTMPSDVKFGHWIAVYLTPNTLEYYDPLGAEPNELFMKNIKHVLDKWTNTPLQFKINRIRYQRTNSNNCGYFSMHFLVNRYKGKKFKDVTGYTKLVQSLQGERDIKRFKKQLKIKDFNLI